MATPVLHEQPSNATAACIVVAEHTSSQTHSSANSCNLNSPTTCPPATASASATADVDKCPQHTSTHQSEIVGETHGNCTLSNGRVKTNSTNATFSKLPLPCGETSGTLSQTIEDELSTQTNTCTLDDEHTTSPALDDERSRYVRLISSDESVFKVEKEVAFQCDVIRIMCEGNFMEGHLQEARFPTIRSRVLAKVVDYLRYKHTWNSKGHPMPDFEIEDDIVLDLLLVSNYLGLNT